MTVQALLPAIGQDLAKTASSQPSAVPRANSVTSSGPADTYGEKGATARSGEMASPRGHFARWLSSYGHAWTTGNPGEVVSLFSRAARYYETPFEAPMIGRDAIYKYWAEGVKHGQSNVTFRVMVISVEHNVGVAHWHATFTRATSGAFVELDGILQATFDSKGKCVEFKEWWHRRETEKSAPNSKS